MKVDFQLDVDCSVILHVSLSRDIFVVSSLRMKLNGTEKPF